MHARGKICTPVVILALAGLVLFGGQVDAVDFLRGDSNSDGKVTISDAHFALNYLFRGGSPADCLKTMDVDASGKLNLTDSIKILNYLFRGGQEPEAPFPEPGGDQGASEAAAAVACDAYEYRAPLEDPEARIEVLEAVAAGGAEGRATVTLAVSNSGTIAGLSGTILVDPDVVGTVDPTATDVQGVSDPPAFSSVTLTGEHLTFGFLSTLVGVQGIPAGDGVTILELTICLRDGTLGGDYPLALVAAELVDFDTGRAIQPVAVDGILTVLEAVETGAGCEPSDPGDPDDDCPDPLPWPDPPPPVNAMFEIRGARAAAGTDVTLPFSIVADAPVQAYSFSVDFDEEVLEPLGVDILFDIDRRPPPCDAICPGYTHRGFANYEINAENDEPGSSGIDEGFLIGAFVFSFFDNCHNIPANDQTDVLDLSFRVLPDTDATSTEVRFLDGAEGSGAPMSNVLTAYGHAWSPETASTFILINGLVDVLPEIVVFVRGDTNGDETVDLTDAVSTLSYLFLGEEPPYCLDAADANDDGDINVADPIATLMYLFLGGPTLRAPFPEAGPDPTEDNVTCSTWIR